MIFYDLFCKSNIKKSVLNTNTCLNGGIDCRAEFAQNEDDDAGKLTLVKEKDEVLSKFCRQVV